ncbi:MAG: BtrH N-terminal domain-containing protein [Proteobacteria bacterium]|nr:BtrH N-terminal domain-containing protein [Pseudomonadota bacterium]
MRVINPYTHRQAAHCESGVVRALLEHAGLPISEPMAFGLSRSLVFVHLPLLKIGGQPLTSYRMPPRSVITGIGKILGARFATATFRDPRQGMDHLDAHLAQGRIVGVQTSVFWLPYFPDGMRFHFNAHNLIVYGRDGDDYLIGDPVFAETSRCDARSLMKARFIKGMLAPKGFLYFPGPLPKETGLIRHIRPSIKATARMMAKSPLPFVGAKGIAFLARRIGRLTRRDPEQARLFLGNIIRMQEEIGTGGAGFRFLYASFLQESAALLHEPCLREASMRMTAIGDEWREFALLIARFIKNHRVPATVEEIADKLTTIARMEQAFFAELGRWA